MPQYLTVRRLLSQLQELERGLPIRLAINSDFTFAHYVGANVVVRNGTAFIADDGQRTTSQPGPARPLAGPDPFHQHHGSFHLITPTEGPRFSLDVCRRTRGDILDGWPQGMRPIARKKRECPHPGAQLSFTDADRLRLTVFATNAPGVPIAALEHRQWARAEGCIRAARATGLRNLAPARHRADEIWLEIVQLALDQLALLPMLALTGKPKLWQPCRLRLRLLSAAAQLVTTARRRYMRVEATGPWIYVIIGALAWLECLPNPS